MDTITEPPVTTSATVAAGSPQERFATLLGQHRGIVLKIAHGY